MRLLHRWSVLTHSRLPAPCSADPVFQRQPVHRRQPVHWRQPVYQHQPIYQRQPVYLRQPVDPSAATADNRKAVRHQIARHRSAVSVRLPPLVSQVLWWRTASDLPAGGIYLKTWWYLARLALAARRGR